MADSSHLGKSGSAAGPSPIVTDSATVAESIDVLPDGGVVKRVIQEGSGDVPPLHARCLVHYVGRLGSSGDVFLDTKAESQSGEPVQVVAGRDSSMREVGLNLAVATMRKGERCHVRVQPKYGYGERGSFSFPNVPPHAELEYEVELVDFDPADEMKDRGEMTYEERLEAAERHRLKGNALFLQGENTDALGKYAMALSYINEDFMIQLEGPHADKAESLKIPIHLNMAACQIKLQDWQGVMWNCSQVLAKEKGNAKALFRRGRAHNALGHTEEALQDLAAASRAAPDDRAIAREIQVVKANMRRDREAQAKMFKGAFGSPGERRDKGLWEDGRSGTDLNRAGKVSTLGWLWGLLLGWLGLLFGLKSLRR
ncbi:g1474 [Coccomyxa elongata]